MKAYKRTVLITCIVILLPMIIGFILWNRFPDRMPVHFGFSGEADGYGSKVYAIVGTPLILLGVQLLCAWFTTMDKRAMALSSKVINMVLWIIPITTWVVMVIMYMKALKSDINVPDITMILLGILFIVICNYLPKCRQNYVIGIKIPTTLYDEDNWNRTHRMAGKLWVVAGIAIVILSVTWKNPYVLVGIILVTVIVPVIYSYVISKK